MQPGKQDDVIHKKGIMVLSSNKKLQWIALLLSLIAAPVRFSHAETITVGKGSGLIWEGRPFSFSLSGPTDAYMNDPTIGMLSFTTNTSNCFSTVAFQPINGYKTIPAVDGKDTGLGLIPRATAVVKYPRYGKYGSDMMQTMTATMGLPETRGGSADDNNIEDAGRAMCLPVSSRQIEYFFWPYENRTVSVSGTWALMANGNQKSGEYTVQNIYFASFSKISSGNRYASLFGGGTKIRVSTLECMVNTPQTVNFGNVLRNLQKNTELAVMQVPFNVSCGQASDFVNANINVQFRALSGLYETEPTKLSLKQGGGYITGEIDGGITGSGTCSAPSGVTFDSRDIRIGDINGDISKQFTNQIIWRLCSGGSSLPTGMVTASTEMNVTFN